MEVTSAMFNKFKFLGSIITPDGESFPEIKARLGQARSVASNLADVWKSRELSLELKKRMAKALVWSVALYGCESWALRKREEDMINAFEMWVWRRLLRVSWRDRRTNDWVRSRIGAREEELLREIKRRKIKKYRHWKRRASSLVIATVEGEIGAKGRRGRRKVEWADNISQWEGGMESAWRRAWREPTVL